MKQNSDRYSETMSKKSRAHYFIVMMGYSQREASELVGISERTMSIWAKKYDWKVKAEKKLIRKGGVHALMQGFIEFVNKRAPGIKDDVKSLWDCYLETIEKEISK